MYVDYRGNKVYGEWINGKDAFDLGYLEGNQEFIFTGIQIEAEYGSRNGRQSSDTGEDPGKVPP